MTDLSQEGRLPRQIHATISGHVAMSLGAGMRGIIVAGLETFSWPDRDQTVPTGKTMD